MSTTILSRVRPSRLQLLVCALAISLVPLAAHAQTLNTLHSFGVVPNDGLNPEASLVQGNDGNFYGTTFAGGTKGYGSVFKITPSGSLTTLYSFVTNQNDGIQPSAALIQARDGNFYGTTETGAASAQYGVVFRVTPAGVETPIYTFAGGNDGNTPKAALVQGANGNLYGTTRLGGATLGQGNGTIFEVTLAGSETLVYRLGSNTSQLDGLWPGAPLILASDGNFYGTTTSGGGSNYGAIIKMTPTGSESLFYNIGNNGLNGIEPGAPLVQGTDGSFYGTTRSGGSNDEGVVFKLTLGGSYTPIYTFPPVSTTNGANPYAGLVQGSDGNFYGTTRFGGIGGTSENHGNGVIFKVTPAGAESVVYRFGTNPNEGAQPWAGLIIGSDGNLYGTTTLGGSAGGGTVFQLILHPTYLSVGLASTNANPSLAKAGDVVSLTFTMSEAIQAPVVSLAGQSVSAVNTTGNTWKASLTVTNAHPEGPAAFSIVATDLAGYTAPSQTAVTDNSAVRIDHTSPSVSAIGISSSNGNGSYAKLGDTLTLRFTASETITPPVVTVDGQAASVSNPSGNQWIATITVATTFSQGIAGFSITPTDLAGNQGGAATGTTDGSSVTVDPAPPTLSQVTITSSNPNPSYARAGDSIILGFNASEAIEAPAVSICGQPATTANPSGNHWTASVTVAFGFPAGPASFSIVATDVAGNIAAPVTQTNDGSNVTVDLTPPSYTLVNLVSTGFNPQYARTGDKLNLTFTSNEAIQTATVFLEGQAVAATNISGNSWTASLTLTNAFPQGPAVFSLASTDFAGNTSVAVNTTTNGSAVQIDFLPPALSPVSIASSNANPAYAKIGDTITLTFVANEDIQIPAVTIAGQNAAVVNPSGHLWSATVIVSSQLPQGPAAYAIAATDLAGNAATPITATTDGSSVTIRLGPPQIVGPVTATAVANNRNPQYAAINDSVDISFTTDVPIQVNPGISVDGHPAYMFGTSQNFTQWRGEVSVTADFPQGPVTCSLTVTDLAGNSFTYGPMTPVSPNVTIDTIAPTISAAGVPGRGYIAGSPMPDLRSLLSLNDTNAPLLVAQFPPAGTALATGPLSVLFTVSDPAGNHAEAGSTISISPATPVTTVGASRGQVIVGQPPGTHYGTFGPPETGPFGGTVVRQGNKKRAAFGADGSVLLEVGAAAPGLNGAIISRLGTPSGDAVLATLKNGVAGIDAHNDVVLYTGLAAGNPIAAAQTGTPAAGLPAAATIARFGAIDGNGTDTFFFATLRGPGIHAKNALALCAIDQGALHVLVRREDEIASEKVLIISTLVGSAGTVADSRWRVDDTTIGVRLTLGDHREVIYTIPATATSSSDWTLDAQTGGSIAALPGGSIERFGLPGFGPKGFAVVAHMKPRRGDEHGPNDEVVLVGTDANTLSVLARKGESVEKDANGSPLDGVSITSFSDPIVGEGSAVAYRFRAKGGSIHARSKEWIAYAPDGAKPSILANEDALAPGGGLWKNFKSLVLPKGSATGPVFVATLAVHRFDGVTKHNDLGMWGIDVTGALRLLLRTGEVLTLGGANERLSHFTALAAAGGSIGAGSGYDPDGNTSVFATFTDGRRAIIDIAQP